MLLKEITNYIESIAPLAYQESYDNSGLIIGDKNKTISKVLVCLDSIEEVIDEAIETNCELVIAHHPIVFSGLKKITGKNYIERVILKAIKHDIAIYACHTNLDNVLQHGVNQKIAQTIGLQNQQILDPKHQLLAKLVTFVPATHHAQVQQALFNAGAGKIGAYDSCSFNTTGKGTFKALKNANPHVGEIDELHTENEIKIETIFPRHLQGKLIATLQANHPYEEVAYDIIPVTNKHSQVGSGIVGELPKPINALDFLKELKTTMNTSCIRYTKPHKQQVQTIAICGGAGSFLLGNAKAAKADIFITGDYKYHQFFDAENSIIIADIGHYESEQFTINLLEEVLNNKFTSLKVVKTNLNTNPVHYI